MFRKPCAGFPTISMPLGTETTLWERDLREGEGFRDMYALSRDVHALWAGCLACSYWLPRMLILAHVRCLFAVVACRLWLLRCALGPVACLDVR
jgi:hypothetical protein